MKKRQIDILHFLLLNKRFVSIKFLCNYFNVSERSIRYDIDEIDYFLKKHIGITLSKRYKEGICLEADVDDVINIQKALSTLTINEVATDIDDKKSFIITRLMTANKPLTTSALAEELMISRTTLTKVMSEVYEFFEAKNVEIFRKPNCGIYVKLNEKTWRSIMVDIMNASVKERLLSTLASGIDVDKTKNPDLNSYLLPDYNNSFFRDVDFVFLIRALNYAQRDTDIKLADVGCVSLLIHLALCVKRAKHGNVIEMSEGELASYKKEPEYKLALKLGKYILENKGIELPEAEMGYITLHLLGAKKIAYNYDEDLFFVNAATMLIFYVQDALGVFIPFTESFLNDLIIHLKPAFMRAKNNLLLTNPLLEMIKGKYGKIFEATFAACNKLSYSYQTPKLSEDEVAYVAMHIGALLERAYPMKRLRIKALLICSEGIATTKMLSARISQEFSEIEVKAEIPLSELSEQRLKDIDIIISTIDIAIKTNVPFVKVSPVLNFKDIKNIETLLNLKYIAKGDFSTTTTDTLGQIMEAVEENAKIIDPIRLKMRLREILKIKQERQKEEYAPMLSELVTPERILVGYDAKNWEDAVRKAGELLVKSDCAMESYVDAMVKTVVDLGPYIVVARGIALPHARPEKGAKKLAMSIVVLKNPIEFGSRENDPVNVVFGLCAVDDHSHLKALSDLGNFALNEDSFDTLIHLPDAQRVMEYIEEVCTQEL